MFFSARIALKPLADLCHRLAISLEAGVDIRTVCTREANHARGFAARRHWTAIRQAVEQGDSLAAAFDRTDDYFPEVFRELAAVGEQTGHQPKVFAQLADHYQHQLQLRRVFLAAITWPMIQLALALAVVGFLIWIVGFIGQSTGTTIDLLGLGLVGNDGLATYLLWLGIIAGVVAFVVRAIRRGVLWTRPIQRAVLLAPMLGGAVRTMALARVAWAMHLTIGAGMEIRRALNISIRSARNAHFVERAEAIDAQIAQGQSIYDAFVHAGGFPIDFLDALAVGEQSGKLDESMARLSEQYQQQARAALATLTVLAGFAVWGMVALLIIALILRIFSFYLGAINDAMKPL